MNFPFFQLDAFVDGPFTGNPAAVCVLPDELPDATLLAIARENNLSETAFLRASGEGWSIRWFTPAVEVDLCGHATLAAGAVALERLDRGREAVSFESRSGPLGVARDADAFRLDFPAWSAAPADAILAGQVAGALGAGPSEVWEGPYLMAVFDSARDVAGLVPDLDAVASLPSIGVVATAPGADADFVSRFFAPAVGVPEDPVTGSAHCLLAPWWARRMGRDRLVARQISSRTGMVRCEVRGDRVWLGGAVRFVIEGTFRL